MNFAFIQPWMQ